MPTKQRKAVDFMMDRILPEDLRQDTYQYDKKGIGKLMGEVAKRYPERYAEIAKRIGDLGRNAAWSQGTSIRLKDLQPVIDTAPYLQQMDAEIAALRKKNLPPDVFERERGAIYVRYSDLIEKETTKAALRNRNSLAASVTSGARGSTSQLKAMLSTPGVYSDAADNVIPLFVRRSFGQGVSLGEHLAGTYGARKSLVSSKKAVAEGGDWGKISSQAAATQRVTTEDCGTNNGILLPVDDPSLRGRYLAKPLDNAPENTPVDRRLQQDMKKRKTKEVVVRSPLSCQAKSGVCAKCLGLGPGGKPYQIGDSVGLDVTTTLREPIAQGSLNAKHTGGVASGKKEYSGFKYLSQFTQVPEEFEDATALSEVDGVVTSVDVAPQGGHYVTVNNSDKYYVRPGLEPTVNVGQEVEAGDELSNGLTNPADVVRLKGMGAGRDYYTKRLHKLLEDSGQGTDRRNIELYAKATLRHYRVNDVDDVNSPLLPDDVIDEERFRSNFQPAEDARELDLNKARGMYLQAPALHHTPGTRVTNSIRKELEKAGVAQVLVSAQEPKIKPEMQRLRSASHVGDDWFAQQYTSYLQKQLQEAGTRGSSTNIKRNPHFAPRLAVGVDFAKDVRTTGDF